MAPKYRNWMDFEDKFSAHEKVSEDHSAPSCFQEDLETCRGVNYHSLKKNTC